MNTLAKKIFGAVIGFVLAFAVMFFAFNMAPGMALALAAASVAFVLGIRQSSYRFRLRFLACACAMIFGVSAWAGVIQYSSANIIYLDSTGTNGVGIVNGNLVNKRGETWTTNYSGLLIYTSDATHTNSVTLLNGFAVSTNHVLP